jgi:hypothetical protein
MLSVALKVIKFDGLLSPGIDGAVVALYPKGDTLPNIGEVIEVKDLGDYAVTETYLSSVNLVRISNKTRDILYLNNARSEYYILEWV